MDIQTHRQVKPETGFSHVTRVSGMVSVRIEDNTLKIAMGRKTYVGLEYVATVVWYRDPEHRQSSVGIGVGITALAAVKDAIQDYRKNPNIGLA